MQIDQILHMLERARGYLPEAALREAVKMRKEITPHLLRVLENLSDPLWVQKNIDDEYFLHIHGMYLLAQFRESLAYPILIKICMMDEDILNRLFGDVLSESMPSVLASVCGGDLQPIKSLIEDFSLFEIARGAALTSLQVMVHEGIVSRAEVIDYYAELFRGGIRKEDSCLLDDVICEALDLHAVSLEDEIRSCFSEGIVDTMCVTIDELSELHLPEEEFLEKQRMLSRGLVDKAVEFAGEWPCFYSCKYSRKERLERGSSDVYLLRVELHDVKPLIWRVFMVPASITLDRLHDIIQIVMGWNDIESHEFTVHGKKYSDSQGKKSILPEGKYRLGDITGTKGDNFNYYYGSEVAWNHQITIEDIEFYNPEIPLWFWCFDGQRACPPDGVGGAEGYKKFCSVLKNPNHKDYNSTRMWYMNLPGRDVFFDPEKFISFEANKLLDLYRRYSGNRIKQWSVDLRNKPWEK